jgi:hypothetical protein
MTAGEADHVISPTGQAWTRCAGLDDGARGASCCGTQLPDGCAGLLCVPCWFGPAFGGRAAKPEPTADTGPAVPLLILSNTKDYSAACWPEVLS